MFAALFAVALWLGGHIAALTPFAWERALADAVLDPPDPEDRRAVELQALADRLAAHMDLPEGMTLTVHFVDDPLVNALATLGGNIYMFRGLIDRLDSENALATVLAHEIAHVRYRDPARALGGGLLAGLVMSVVLGNTSGWGEEAIGGSGRLIQLRHGRDAERRADRAALAAVAAEYGHVNGATHLFEALLSVSAAREEDTPAILSTHPMTRARIAAVEALAQAEGWATTGTLTPLGQALSASSPN